ncbi:hypothetical protein Pyn_11320 [Prunus yedoensis var. nudiflora]|uniref:Uncharacterized protein n=1 Tax=Prunus yedoensis var. nudiflora TaxID=2094558 RepID=A0A314YXW7_PRUYE|nr:hypothetical protein Pyn_11320 [Prunus yedoensis var. nudiflora]
MNPSHVVYGACMRDCGVEGYGGPQGPRKPLDNGDFGLATWEHQSPSPLLRVLQCGEPSPSINWEAFAQPKPTSLSCCKLLNNHENSSSFIILAAASIPAAIPAINLHLLTAASIPAAVNQHLLVAQAPNNHRTTSISPFGCCMHSSSHPSHSSTITTKILLPLHTLPSYKCHGLQASSFSSHPPLETLKSP